MDRSQPPTDPAQQPEPSSMAARPGSCASESAQGAGADSPQPINSFALVAYIPDPLGAFLDQLRRELVPNCIPRAHVTILPARSLRVTPEQAWRLICERLAEFPAFEIEPGGIEVFENTTVAYIAVARGWDELVRMHDALSQGELWFPEPYSYHPHITVAQDFAPDQLWRIAEQARQRWAHFPHVRSFLVDAVTFVQAASDNRWLDLAQCPLAAPCLR